MRYREKHRVDWDEELRKTERIRRKGLFISVLGFAVAVVFILGAGGLSSGEIGVSRKFIFALCVLFTTFIVKLAWGRRERLKRQREEEEQEREWMRFKAKKQENDG